MNSYTSSMNILTLSCILSAAVMEVGCVAASEDPAGDAPAGGAPVGEATQAFTNYGALTRNLQAITDPGIVAAPSTSFTCFLSGTFGQFPEDDRFTGGARSGVQFSPTEWRLFSEDVTGLERIGTHVVCLPTTANRITPHFWHTGLNAVQLGPVQGNRVCGLTSVSTINGSDFTSSSDEVKVFTSGGFWWLGGSGNAAGSAGCVDMTNNFTQVGVWRAGTVTKLNLTQAPDSGGNPLGVQCFLQGVQGAFTTNSYSNGIGVSFDPGLLQWSLNVSTGKTGTAVCIQ